MSDTVASPLKKSSMAFSTLDFNKDLRSCCDTIGFNFSELPDSMNKSAGGICRALAMRLRLSAEGKRFFVSILPISVGEQPTFSASSIWDMFKISLKFFMFWAKSTRTSVIYNEFPPIKWRFYSVALDWKNRQ